MMGAQFFEWKREVGYFGLRAQKSEKGPEKDEEYIRCSFLYNSYLL